MVSSFPLTDTQLVLLSAASQREDGLLVQPERLKGIVAEAVTSKLLARAYIEEIPVGSNEPHWRQDADGRPVGLRITPFGLIAIGLGCHDGDEVKRESVVPLLEEAPPFQPETPVEPPAERPGTKRSLVVSLLQREDGADLDDLIQATGWLPHTTRAALTGLRQRGYGIGKRKNPQGRTIYFIKDAEPQEGSVNRPAVSAEVV